MSSPVLSFSCNPLNEFMKIALGFAGAFDSPKHVIFRPLAKYLKIWTAHSTAPFRL